MLVNHERKFIAISVPKTGSTSIHHGLMNAANKTFEAKNGAPAIYHLSARDIKSIMGDQQYNSYYSFGMVRNPFDRLVSLYHDFRDQRGAIKSSKFEDFVLFELEDRWKSNVHFFTQEFFICDGGDVITSEVFRFEDGVSNAFRTLINKLGLNDVDIGHARKSERSGWESYYSNDKVAEVVLRMYRRDFEVFGYHGSVAQIT